jgi:N terminus of Rad21 / Rec8 like protein
MVGIVRVYRQQTDFLYSDINSVLINFKKAMYDLQSATADLNMPRDEATYVFH